MKKIKLENAIAVNLPLVSLPELSRRAHSCPKTFSKSPPVFTKHFSQKPTSYASPAHLPRWKLTANGFSSYELFTKKCDFHAFLQCEVHFFMKNHFFILSHLRSLYKGFCVFAPETSCCSYFTNMTICWPCHCLHLRSASFYF